MASVTEAADGGAVRRLLLAVPPSDRQAVAHARPAARVDGRDLPRIARDLLVSSFWRLDVFTGEVVRDPSLVNFQTLLDNDVYRTITLRTVGIALAVTLGHRAGLPARVLRGSARAPRMRNALLIAVVLPLWANYLVRVFAWRPPHERLPELARGVDRPRVPPGRQVQLGDLDHVRYLWLPFTLLPIYAAIERVPDSLLEASGDLGGRGWFTFRRVVFPLIVPGIVAGSIFSFSLTLGDYIVPELVGNTQFIGNVIYDNVGVAGNVPARGRVRPRADRGHGRLSVPREAPGRVRGALTMESRAARILLGAGTVVTLVFLYVPLADRGDLRVQRRDRPGLADPGLHVEVVRDRVRTAAVRKRCSTRSRWRCSRRWSRCSSGARPPSPCTGSGSSGGTRSRSSSCSRSRCPGS